MPRPHDKIKKTLDALNKLGAIQHDRHHVTITDHAILAHITTLWHTTAT